MVETSKELQDVKAATSDSDINASSTSAGLTSSASEGEDAVGADLISDTESIGESEAVAQMEAKATAISDDASMKSDAGSSDEITKSEEFKSKGNELFKLSKFDQAIDQYTEAIFCKIPNEKKAVYYCNRALANLRMENNAVALFDSCECIKLDKTNVKGYYRRGQAYVALRQLKHAVQDFLTVCKMQPKNKDARDKYEMTKKEHRLNQLSAAVLHEEKKIEVDIKDIVCESSYTGPKLDDIDQISPEWITKMMDWMRDGKVLHKKFACMIIMKATEIFEQVDSLVDIEIEELEEITVCGDVHGQFYDLLNIFKLNGNPSEDNPYLFNGDFIDRGSFSVEVILTLLAWKVCYPQHFFMSRGNHEAKQLNKMYGFEGEVKHKYDIKVYDIFSQLFCFLPICHVINKKVMVTHGGLFSKDGITLDQIRAVDRKRETPDSGIMCEALWSDPCDMDGRHASKRGVGVMFGPDVAQNFLDNNKLKLLVRSHEVKSDGYEYQKGGKVLTVFSAPNYCDQMGNKGAFVRFQGADMEPKITSFDKVDHPKIPPMAYAQQWSRMFM